MGETEQPAMLERYGAWLQSGTSLPGEQRRPFFTQGLIVLDTNVLLSLYEYTAPARTQVLSALGRVSDRLWLPYQVGLEFVRGRHRVIASRTSALQKASGEVNRRLNEARQTILEASGFVQQLLTRYARDEAAVGELNHQINQASFDERFAEWKDILLQQIAKLKAEQDIALPSLASNDPVLPQVAALYSSRVGDQPAPEILRQRVDEAINHRFPNRIPPGFSDQGKRTPIQEAGDFLIWEEIVDIAKTLTHPRRVLFISADSKNDWYEPEEPGRGPRPWPSLTDELLLRAGASLCIETPRQFFQGVKQFLDVEIAEATYEEIDRASEVLDPPEPDRSSAVTEENALDRVPPRDVVLHAYRCAGLTTSAVRTAAESDHRADRLFQWWLIGVTAQLGRRKPTAAETEVSLHAATRASTPPAPHWQPGTVLKIGEWPYRASSWVAPWFIQLLSGTAESDRLVLQRIAAQQVDDINSP
ncbi:PIN-like domain-containing protein [Streptomyces sp. NPDC001127]|uniref:PIN-like domain-containing protein n=1 Tax=Streptomyces sp. NPDC001127 TaxID=3154377 RepID=UPI00332FFB08